MAHREFPGGVANGPRGSASLSQVYQFWIPQLQPKAAFRGASGRRGSDYRASAIAELLPLPVWQDLSGGAPRTSASK